MVLTQEEIDACRAAFQAFDADNTGTLDVAALRGVLGFLGQKPTEDELFMMIAEVDEEMSGMLDFGELLRVIEVQKMKALAFDDEGDMVDAFVACGGRADKLGHVKRETLVRIIKKDFGLMIDIEELINKVDTDGSGEIEYQEFKMLLS
ncbi:dynein light chain [Nannochloropsis oceanica]